MAPLMLSSEKKMLCCQLYNSLYNNTNQKIASAIKVATMKITDNFCYEWKPSCAYNKIKAVSKDEWDSNEGPSTSMKNALHA